MLSAILTEIVEAPTNWPEVALRAVTLLGIAAIIWALNK